MNKKEAREKIGKLQEFINTPKFTKFPVKVRTGSGVTMTLTDLAPFGAHYIHGQEGYEEMWPVCDDDHLEEVQTTFADVKPGEVFRSGTGVFVHIGDCRKAIDGSGDFGFFYQYTPVTILGKLEDAFK